MSKKLSLFSIVSCALIFLSFFLSVFNFTSRSAISTVSAAPGDNWFDPAWNYRTSVTVSCPCATAQGEYQVRIVLGSTFSFSHARSDGADIRITASNGITPIPFWIENWDSASTSATIWVKMPNIPLAGTSIYIYYGNASPATNLVEMPPTGPWTRAAGNPIIPSNSGGTSLLAENIVYDSTTLKYWMALANYSSGSVALVSSTNPTNPAAWQWEGNVVFPVNMYSGAPHLIQENGTWYLFYADRPNIMVATSANVAGPYTNNRVILSPSADWETYRVDEPYVIKRNDGTWVLIYMADYRTEASPNMPNEQVGYATSDTIDGTYTKYSLNPVLPFGPVGSYDHGTIADPWVVEYHGTYYIGYTVSSTQTSPWQTAYATTTDWITFTKHGITLPLAASGWDSVNAFRGAVTRIGDTYVFSYTGDSYQMGIATQPVYRPVNQEADVFPFYDEFSGTSLDTTKWTLDNGILSQAVVAGGELTLTGTGSYIKIHGNTSFGMDYLVEASARHPEAGSDQHIPEIGLAGATLDNTVRLAANFHTTIYWERQAKTGSETDIWINMAQTANNSQHTFRIYRTNPNIAGFQIDNTPAETYTTGQGSTTVPTGNLPAFLMSYGSGNHFVIDWIRVRNYCGEDVTATVGSEEPRPLLPHIRITISGDSPVLVGSPASFSITVTNNGDYELNNVTVTDALAPNCNRSFSILAIGQSESYTCSLANASQDFTNTAVASGTPTTGGPVSSTVSVFIDVLHPLISISVSPASQAVIQGDPATFNITVTNSGDTSLSTVAVTDEDVPDCARSVGTLTVGQIYSYTCSMANTIAGYTNSATVSATGPLGSSPTASATASVSVIDLSSAAWMNPSWAYRQSFKVSCPCSNTVSDYQVKITLDSSFAFSHALLDGSDIRVTGIDGTTQIPFWIESWNPSATSATIWVKLPELSLSGTAVFIYYGNTNPPAQPLVETPPIGPWTRDASNPIVPIDTDGTLSLLAENIVYDSVTGHYWMVLANYSNGGVSLVWSDTPGVATSWHWQNTVIASANAPHLVHFGDTWYIFYSDWSGDYNNPHSLRAATASSVTGPYVYTGTPILSPSETWETWRVDEPFVFQRNDGKWILVYMADQARAVEQVGYAIADNILGPYTKYSGNPVLAFGPTGTFDAGTIADPWVYEYHGTYYIGYTVSPTSSSPWQTAYATTTDWVNFTKHGITLPLAASGWDSVNAFRGAVLRVGDTYVFSYTGDGYRMGIATQPVFRQDPFNEPAAVFPFYDNFNDGSFDATKWFIDSGSISQISEADGNLTLTASGQVAGQYVKIQGQSTFGMDYMVEGYARHPQWGTLNMISEIGLVGPGTSGDKLRIADDFHNITYWERQAALSTTGGDLWENMAVPADADWHTFRVYRNSGSQNIAGFQIDNNPVETTSTTVPTSNLPPFLMSFGAGNQMEVDWIRVRRWCGSEPLLTAGAEQSNPTAVELNYFRASRTSGGVLLTWETVNEATLAGFNLNRREPGGEFVQVNAELIAPQMGGQPLGSIYTFLDEGIPLDRRYEYRLEGIETNLQVGSFADTTFWPYSTLLPAVLR